MRMPGFTGCGVAVAAFLLNGCAFGGTIVYSSNFGNNTITAYDALTGALLGTRVTAGPELSGLNGVRVNAAIRPA